MIEVVGFCASDSMTNNITAIYSLGQIIFKLAGQQIKQKNYLDEIEQIRKDLVEIYFDMARIHLKSAEESLIAATRSSAHTTDEIMSAIHHFYDAYNTIKKLEGKKTTKTFLLIFKSEELTVDSQLKIYEPCVKIGILIHSLYCLLGEKDNATDWREHVIQDFYVCLDYYGFDGYDNRNFSGDEYNRLKNITPKYEQYVKEDIEEHTKYNGFLGDGNEMFEYETEYTVKYILTSEGKRFCNQLRADFIKNILFQIVDNDILLSYADSSFTRLKQLYGKEAGDLYDMALFYKPFSPQCSYQFLYTSAIMGFEDAQKDLESVRQERSRMWRESLK